MDELSPVQHEHDEHDEDSMCVPPPPPESAPEPPGSLGSPEEEAQLWLILQGETYRQRGEGLQSGWAFHRTAGERDLGAPLARSASVAEFVTLDGNRYGFQPFAGDTLFNVIPNWSQVQSLNELLGGNMLTAGLGRSLLEAAYGAVNATLHADWSFHRVALRERLGLPLSDNYRITVAGRQYALQVFAGDTLCTPIAEPEANTDWSVVQTLSSMEPGELREALWAESYKPSGAPYQPAAPFQQLAMEARLGTPLTGPYTIDIDGRNYTVQVFALDTLYQDTDGSVKRQSSLQRSADGGGEEDPPQPEEPVTADRRIFQLLPVPGRPRVSQFYGYTKWSAGGGRKYYKLTQGQHSGIDFSVPVGTDLLAVATGVVVGCGVPKPGVLWGGCPPFVILVRYGDVYAVYGHCSVVHVRKGQIVRAGEVIGKSGDYGGPHLHFELRPVPQAMLTVQALDQEARNPATALNPLDYFGPDLKGYWEEKLQRLNGTAHFCRGGVHDQSMIRFGAEPDTRPCTN